MLVLKMGHREFTVTEFGSVFVRTARVEFYIQRDKAAPWWPQHDPVGNGEGEWRGFGLKVTYNRAPADPLQVEGVWPAAR